jgi:polyferredoxin
MIKFIGIFFMFISWVSLSNGFSFSLALWFLFGLFLVCSQGIFSHIMFKEREKVRAQYRRRR